jgi:hypothetical protein
VYDHYDGTDIYRINVMRTFIGGLNLGMGPYVVLKLEYNRIGLDEVLGGSIDVYQSQLAMTF